MQCKNNVALTIASKVPAGDPGALKFACQPDVSRWWRDWFAKWKHIRAAAFICEDIWWRRSSDISVDQASQTAEKVVNEWLASSSLERFELWSGADSIQLSQQLQVMYARFHNIHNGTEPTRHRYLFRRDENTSTWTLCPPTVQTCSAISQFCEHVCVDGCWICIAIEDNEGLEHVISYLDNIREENRHGRIMDSLPWSRLDCDHSYRLYA